jgi:hypothetical protein
MWIVTDRGDYAAETDICPPIATVSLHYLFPARPWAPVLAWVLTCSSAALTCSVTPGPPGGRDTHHPLAQPRPLPTPYCSGQPGSRGWQAGGAGAATARPGTAPGAASTSF